ncbi:hypothetical protein Pyn_00067 [Prunus yedoensis var. nudiflora]|uniref:Uncharacterized protein n=1 Tax=Prunus yedoensis var. nudiflora TaxID=2094558 RepID=A0A314YRW8_PRUYE|nr:hypothetical protein Pyn_00067 [Prunus yedoensis var. nudiflora]
MSHFMSGFVATSVRSHVAVNSEEECVALCGYCRVAEWTWNSGANPFGGRKSAKVIPTNRDMPSPQGRTRQMKSRTLATQEVWDCFCG